MRKLKLQVQLTLDGFVAGPEGQLDWMTSAGDAAVLDLINELTDSSDTILMGRKMAPGFIGYWEHVVDNQGDSPEYPFAGKMVDLPKIVFSKTQQEMAGRNVSVENGDLVAAVNRLKAQPGKDLIVYGGAGFVSSLIENNLIDEYYFFVNPVAIGQGMRIFHDRKHFELRWSRSFGNGEVVQHYVPAV